MTTRQQVMETRKINNCDKERKISSSKLIELIKRNKEWLS